MLALGAWSKNIARFRGYGIGGLLPRSVYASASCASPEHFFRNVPGSIVPPLLSSSERDVPVHPKFKEDGGVYNPRSTNVEMFKEAEKKNKNGERLKLKSPS